jgi:urease accessory protein
VTAGDRLLMHDPVVLRQSDGELTGRLGRFDVLAVVVLVGRSLLREAEKLVAAVSARRIVRRADQLIAASRLGEDGCLIRLASTSIEQLERTVRELLRFVPERLGDDPWTRKW